LIYGSMVPTSFYPNPDSFFNCRSRSFSFMQSRNEVICISVLSIVALNHKSTEPLQDCQSLSWIASTVSSLALGQEIEMGPTCTIAWTTNQSGARFTG
jgi:hypothetical protein